MKTLLFQVKIFINRIRYSLPANRRHRELCSLLRNISGDAVLYVGKTNENRDDRIGKILERIMQIAKPSPFAIPSNLATSIEKLDSIIEILRSEPFAALKTWVDRTERDHVRQSKIIDELTSRWKKHSESMQSESIQQRDTIRFLRESFVAVQNQNLMLVDLLAKQSLKVEFNSPDISLTGIGNLADMKAGETR